MQPLPTQLTRGAYTLTQILRTPTTAIYEQSKDGKVHAFEVIRIRTAKAHTWPNGITTPEHEAYPGDNKWGADGFTCLTLADANRRLKQIEDLPQA